MWQSQGILNVFKMLALKNVLWETKTFLKKTGGQFFSSKYYESKKNIKTKANVKTNWMRSAKWTHHKE